MMRLSAENRKEIKSDVEEAPSTPNEYMSTISVTNSGFQSINFWASRMQPMMIGLRVNTDTS